MLADLATAVLPDNARLDAGKVEIEKFVDGLASPGNSYKLLSQAGLKHVFAGHDWAMAYEGTLAIQVINASQWRDPEETLDTGSGNERTVVGEHAKAVLESFQIKGVSSSASFNASRLATLIAQGARDFGSGSSGGPLRFLTVALTGGETSGVSATTLGSTRRALRLVLSGISRNVLKQRDLLLVVRGTTRSRPLGYYTWGEPRVSERWLAATMETRVNESFLPTARTKKVNTGLYLPALGDTAAGPASLAQPGYDRWFLIHGEGVATPAGGLASGRTAAETHEALDSHGFPDNANLILAINKASSPTGRSFAAELARLRPGAYILATERPNILGHDTPTKWQLYHGVDDRISLLADLDASVEWLDVSFRGATSTAAAGTSVVPELLVAKGDRPQRQPAAFTAPENTRYEGHVLVVDSGQSWQSTAVTPEQIVQAAQHANRPVIAINVLGGLTADGPELTALRTALQRYEWLGVQPVVVATAGPREFLAVRDQYRPVTIQLRPAGLGHTWQLADTNGTVAGENANLTAELFGEARELPVTPHGQQLPSVLAGLLGQNTWRDGERYLRQNVSALMEPAVEDALRELRQRESDDSRVGAYEAILGMVRQAGGVAPLIEPRFRPAESKVFAIASEFGLPGPFRETFAFDYLVPKADPKVRKPWNDQLLWLMYSKKLSVAQAVALAEGVHEVSARSAARDGGRGEMVDHGPANATVFAAIGNVLGIDRATAEHLAATTDPVAANKVLGNAVKEIQACKLDPFDRMFWVGRIDELTKRMTQAEGPADPNTYESRIAGLLRILSFTLSQC